MAKWPILFLLACLIGCPFSGEQKPSVSRYSYFIGVDISGSFKKGPYFRDSIKFLSHYIYAHLNGLQQAQVPAALFVGPIGGRKANEPKTFSPIHEFKYKSIDAIEKTLFTLFPKGKSNPYTDYNAFFRQVEDTVKSRKLLMKPINIILLSDGVPDIKKYGDYRKIYLNPLEVLSRNVTVRLLYTTATVGANWRKKIPRKRIRMWTQDAAVMKNWKAKTIMQPGKKFQDQDRFFEWMKDNVDFAARVERVD